VVLYGTITFANGVWEGALAGDGLTGVGRLSCIAAGSSWQFDAVVTRADCSLLAVSVPLALTNFGDVLVGLNTIGGRVSCPSDAAATVEASVAYPCAGGSGSGNNCTASCDQCPLGMPRRLARRTRRGVPRSVPT
jgi:hypothetical protein